MESGFSGLVAKVKNNYSDTRHKENLTARNNLFEQIKGEFKGLSESSLQALKDDLRPMSNTSRLSIKEAQAVITKAFYMDMKDGMEAKKNKPMSFDVAMSRLEGFVKLEKNGGSGGGLGDSGAIKHEDTRLRSSSHITDEMIDDLFKDDDLPQVEPKSVKNEGAGKHSKIDGDDILSKLEKMVSDATEDPNEIKEEKPKSEYRFAASDHVEYIEDYDTAYDGSLGEDELNLDDINKAFARSNELVPELPRLQIDKDGNEVLTNGLKIKSMENYLKDFMSDNK